MWGFLKRKPREPIEITYMRAAGQLAPIVSQVNAEGRYVEFLILAPNDLPSPDDFLAMLTITCSTLGLRAFAESIDARIARRDFVGSFDCLIPGDNRDLLSVPRHVVMAISNGRADHAFWSWILPAEGVPIGHEGLVIEKFGLSSFDISIETHAGFNRFVLIATDRRTNQRAFSYGLERSPMTCCIVHIRADGTRFNLGQYDFDMPYETFKQMAVKFAIEQIYDDRCIPHRTLNAIATAAVVDKISKIGFRALVIHKDEQTGPQIIGTLDGMPGAVLVRAAVYPDVGIIDDLTDKEIADLIEDHLLRKRDLYLACVTLTNAEARNEYEKGVLLCNGTFQMSMDQFTCLTEGLEHPGARTISD